MAELAASPTSSKVPIHLQVGGVLLTLTLVLGGGMVAAGQRTAFLDDLQRATIAAQQQARTAQQVLSALQDAETGQRGFLLTQRTYYLDPYYQASSRIDGLLARLVSLAEGTPWLQDEATQLAGVARLKLAELSQTIQIARTQGVPAALAVVLTDEGKAYMDAARLHAGRIVARAEAEYAGHARTLQAREAAAAALMLGGLGVGVLLLGAAALALLLNRGRLLRAQTGRRIEAARLQAAMEHVRDGVAVFDAEERLILLNSRFSGAIGLPGSPVRLGATLGQLADSVTMDPPLLAGPRPDHPVMGETRQGGRTLEIWRSAMPQGGQMVAVADISRRTAAEEIARQAQKMEVLGQMTGGIAHDFNNLLQVVSTNLELATDRLSRIPAETMVLERLSAAGAAVARGARLTRHLLAFARRQPLAPATLDPARLLHGIEDMLRRTLGKAIELELVIGGGLWAMHADPGQLENALLNLALNARDAMTGADGVPTGRLTLEVANAALDDLDAASRVEVAPGQYLMFAVTDSGTGMDAAQAARAIEPFYTTKPDGKGTGLGLPMVFGFAKQSGGHFQLCSKPGRGTTARLYLPRSSLPPAAQLAPAPRSSPASRGELVLLVEDDRAVRLVAAGALRSLGYAVQEAASADSALELLRQGCRPALLFTDVVMPGAITSRELAATAQELLPDLAVLFTSGYTQNSIVHNGQLDPDVRLLSKPWLTEELGDAVRAALDAARPGSGDAAPPRRVLLVEDEPLVRLTTADALAELGFEVLEAGTGAAALRQLHPAPDLMITDLGLPDMDGEALVVRARTLLPALPVVVASGRSGPGSQGVVWLPKPYDGQGLRAAVEEALNLA